MSDRIDTEQAPDAPPSPPKHDPAAFVLRARPDRPIRFKRGVVIVIAACASASVATMGWISLRPKASHILVPADEPSAEAKPPTEALRALPTNYGDAPRLGPPLPGDLGRPILEQQRALAADGGNAAARAQVQAIATERQRQEAEHKAARESPVLVPSGDRSVAPAQPVSGSTAAVPPSATAPVLDPDRDPNGQQHKLAFAASQDGAGDINPHALTAAPSPNMLTAGSVIAASLITGLRSDLPGLVTAQVTERVFDSATGQILLIPQGARLIGSYDSVVAFGQRRALIVWQRIIFPDGGSIRLDNEPAADQSGYAGLADRIDLHTWQLLKGVALSTMLGVSSELALSGQSDLVQALRMSTQDNVARAGDQLTQRSIGIQPTITIRPGAPVRLLVHRDLILTPWHE